MGVTCHLKSCMNVITGGEGHLTDEGISFGGSGLDNHYH